jgi:hypothetical protein
MKRYIIKFHRLNLEKKINGMEPISNYTTQTFNFSFPKFRMYPIKWNFIIFNNTILPLFYLSLHLLKYPYYTRRKVLFLHKTLYLTSSSSSSVCWMLIHVYPTRYVIIYWWLFAQKLKIYFAIGSNAFSIFAYASFNFWSYMFK